MRSRSERPTSFGSAPPRVLVIEDDDTTCRLIERLLISLGCIGILASGRTQALAICAKRPLLHVGIVDATLADGDGLTLVGELRELLGNQAPAFIVCTGRTLNGRAPEGVTAYVQKPFSAYEFMRIVQRTIRQARSMNERP